MKVYGVIVEVIRRGEGEGEEFKARIKRGREAWKDYGLTAETEDHAHWWAFDAIRDICEARSIKKEAA